MMMFTGFASMGVKLIDQAIMGMMLPLSMVGIYSIGVFVTAVMEAPINSLEKIASAKVAEAWAQNKTDELIKIYKESSKYLFLLGGLLFVGLNVCIDYLFEFLPKEYEIAVPVAHVMSLASLINLATGVNSSILAYSKKYIYISFLLVLLIVLAVVNIYWLVPTYGIIGAALAMFISLSTFNILKFLVIWLRFGMQPFDISTLKILFVIIVSFIPYLLLPIFDLAIVNLLAVGTATTVVYLGLSYILKIVPEFHHYLPFHKHN
jgi:O-antigen/teichoic acid export membrane protein